MNKIGSASAGQRPGEKIAHHRIALPQDCDSQGGSLSKSTFRRRRDQAEDRLCLHQNYAPDRVRLRSSLDRPFQVSPSLPNSRVNLPANTEPGPEGNQPFTWSDSSRGIKLLRKLLVVPAGEEGSKVIARLPAAYL